MNYAALYQPILEQIAGLLVLPDKSWAGRCPAHEDEHQSFTARIGREGELLVRCHAKPGCEFKSIAAALNRAPKEFFPRFYLGGEAKRPEPRIVREYDYVDECGRLLYQSVRYDPKDFKQRRPDPERPGQWIYSVKGCRLIPYHLPQLLAADPKRLVCVCEGEKDVETLEGLGFVATTNVAGSDKWLPEWAPWFAARHVALFPDRDAAGYAHALHVAKCLEGAAGPIRIVELPGHKIKDDVTDYVETLSCSAEEKAKLLRGFVAAAPVWLGANQRPQQELHELKMLMARALVLSKCG